MIRYAKNFPYGIKLINDSILRKTSHCGSIDMLRAIGSLANHFIRYPDPLVVPIYSWQENTIRENGVFTYSYTMKRLALLSTEEQRVVSLCCLLFNRPHEIWREAAREEARKSLINYQEDYSELISFMQKAILEKKYDDNHKGNFMKDEFNNYRIIDIEGFICYPHDIEKLNWINKNEGI